MPDAPAVPQRLFVHDIVQASTVTRAIALNGTRQRVTIFARMPDKELKALDLSLLLTFNVGSQRPDPNKPFSWDAVKELFWQGNAAGTPPTIVWTGQAGRFSLRFDPSRPCRLEWLYTVEPA